MMNKIFLIITLLASSCPAMLGVSVYKARSADAILHPGVQYYDYDLCAAVLPQNKNGDANPYKTEEDLLNTDADKTVAPLLSTSTYFELYPNPIHAGEQLTLNYALYADAQLQVYDIVGKLLFTMPINATNRQVKFTLGKLAAGIYKLNITQSGRTLQTFKFNVE
jgi:Secretion system C-terminal sorting domain